MKATVLHSVAGNSSKTSYMKFETGDNVIRVVSVPVRHDTYKKGDGKKFFSEEAVPEGVNVKPTKTFFMWVIDRKDGAIKLLECGVMVARQLEALSENPQYKFDTIPPYDITVNSQGKGTDTRYTLTPHRNDTALTEDEQKAVDELEPLEAYIARKKEWEMRDLVRPEPAQNQTPSLDEVAADDAFNRVFGE